jgi:hypothetical protein
MPKEDIPQFQFLTEVLEAEAMAFPPLEPLVSSLFAILLKKFNWWDLV